MEFEDIAVAFMLGVCVLLVAFLATGIVMVITGFGVVLSFFIVLLLAALAFVIGAVILYASGDIRF